MIGDSAVDIKEINEKIEKESAFVDLLTFEMNKVITLLGNVLGIVTLCDGPVIYFNTITCAKRS